MEYFVRVINTEYWVKITKKEANTFIVYLGANADIQVVNKKTYIEAV